MLHPSAIITKNTSHIYFPLNTAIDPSTLPFPAELIQKELNTRTPIINYKQLVNIPIHVSNLLPTSFDIIGDILLIKLPQELIPYQKEIGQALLTTHKHINVIGKINPVEGELRIRRLEIIAGEQRTHTIHKEFGIELQMDLTKIYFSPRLSSERHRITQQIKKGETIVDMFTGIGPFAIMIAKLASPKHIYAVDKNKDAVMYAKKNCVHNKVQDTITVLHGDAKNIQQILPSNHQPVDRIIMNLPFSSHHFFKQALTIAGPSCILHYYEMTSEDKLEERIHSLKAECAKFAYDMEISLMNNIKSYSPREFYICLDITVKQNADVA